MRPLVVTYYKGGYNEFLGVLVSIIMLKDRGVGIT